MTASNLFATVKAPAGYLVLHVAFQKWQAVSPTGKLLGTYSRHRYAANRCLRDQAGLSW